MSRGEKLFLAAALIVMAMAIFFCVVLFDFGAEETAESLASSGAETLDLRSRELLSEPQTGLEDAGGALEKVTLDGQAGLGEDQAEARGFSGSGGLYGQVVMAGSGALAGARVVLTAAGEQKTPTDPLALALRRLDEERQLVEEILTDDRGRFELRGLGELDDALLRVTHELCETKEIPLGRYLGRDKDVGQITLELGCSLSGRVLDAVGRRPVEDALVYAFTPDKGFVDEGGVFVFQLNSLGGRAAALAQTDSEGRFHLNGLPPGEIRLSAKHADHPPLENVKVELVRGEDRRGLCLELTSGLTISGVVVDNEGNPLPGIQVATNRDLSENIDLSSGWVFSGQEWKEVLTDAEGAFTISGLGPGTHALRAWGTLYPAITLEGIEAGAQGVQLTMAPGGVVYGQVVDDATGAPVDYFELEVKKEGGGRTSSGAVMIGGDAARQIGESATADGAFYVAGLDDDSHRIEVDAPGYAQAVVGGLVTRPGERRELQLRLLAESLLAGMLVSPKGEPVADAAVELVPHDPSQTNSGRNGFRIRRKISGSGGGDDGFRLDPGKTERATTSTEGRFVFRGIPAGVYRLEASHPDHVAPEPQIVDLQEGSQRDDVMLVMRLGGRIEGTIFGKDQRPLPGGALRIRSLLEEESLPRTIDADIDGHYAINGLVEGQYALSLTQEGGGSSMVAIFIPGQEQTLRPGEECVVVTPGETVTLDLYDLPRGSVTGRVSEADQPVEGLQVGLYAAEGFAFMPIDSARSDRDGRFTMTDIKPGDYRIRLALSGLDDPLEEKITVYPGGRVVQDFALPSGRIRGRVVDLASGEPVPGVTVSVKRQRSAEDGPVRQAVVRVAMSSVSSGGGGGSVRNFTIGNAPSVVRSDEEGRFEIRHVKDGSYTIEVSGGGYMPHSVPGVEVREGRETTCPDAVLTRGAVIVGRVVNELTGGTMPKVPIRCEHTVQQEGQPDAQESTMGFTNDEGAFRFEGLKPGIYTIECLGFQSDGVKTVQIDEGDLEKEIELRVQPSN